MRSLIKYIFTLCVLPTGYLTWKYCPFWSKFVWCLKRSGKEVSCHLWTATGNLQLLYQHKLCYQGITVREKCLFKQKQYDKVYLILVTWWSVELPAWSRILRKLIAFWLIMNVFAMEDRVTPEKLILYFDQHSLNLVLFISWWLEILMFSIQTEIQFSSL